MKNFDHFIIDFHCIPGVSNVGMTLDCSNSKCYGVFPVPEEAVQLAQGKPFPYRLKADHNVKALWVMSPDFHPNPEDFENLKKKDNTWHDFEDADDMIIDKPTHWCETPCLKN